MATLTAVLFHVNTAEAHKAAAADILAFLLIRLKQEGGAFAKFVLTVSADVQWNMVYAQENYPVEQVLMQFGYPDSRGTIAYKNAAPLAGTGAGDSRPIIWQEAIAGNAYQLTFMKNNAADVSVRYQLRFKINGMLPAGFPDSFTGEKTIDLTAGTEQLYAIGLQFG